MVGPKRAIPAAAPLLLLVLLAGPASALNTRHLAGRAPTPALIFRGGLGDIERRMIGKVGTYLSSASAGYIRLLQSAPVVTASTLATAGDVIAQKVSFDAAQKEQAPPARKRQTLRDWDLNRMFMFTAFGGFYTGAVQHVWFGILNAPAVARFLPAKGVVAQALART
ncbi:hypothetical protein T484DRAFT_1794531 [Baffinella frigidus]|nr:hypothetical protein T484DRAFT_1794531 [Cryptophyta sp. CCMP2293]